MGIRFRCPNGHKLNVKTYQAGKRGICPYCGAKFTVPAESTLPPSNKPQPAEQFEDPDQTGELGETGRPTPQAAVQQTTESQLPVEKPNSEPPATEQFASEQPSTAESPLERPPGEKPAGKKKAPATDPLSEEPDALWYVRPPSGGQFGPAAADVMRQWIKDGRVTADSLVWREGWPDWVEAVKVFPRLALVRWLPDDEAKKPPPPPPPKPAQKEPPAEKDKSSNADEAADPFVGTESRGKSAAAKRGGGRRRKRSAREIKQRQVNLVIGLSVLAIAMAGVLIWILNK